MGLTVGLGPPIFVGMSATHIIKLVVGMDSLEDFAAHSLSSRIQYEGQSANAVWTRNRPKQADALLNGGSLYRVIKNRICCRQRILGFEDAQDPVKGKMCLIMVSAEIVQTLSKPKRPFQGWRYLKPKDVPRDKGVLLSSDDRPPSDMEDDLREAGLL